MTPRIGLFAIACTAMPVLLCSCVSSTPMYRPGREYRSINTTQFEVIIQKNGRVDLLRLDDSPILQNAFPMVQFAGEDNPRRLGLDGRYSGREEVNDRLGHGPGMVFKRGDGEWAIRAYLTQPFITVQAAFVNTTKKPVYVAKLLPLCVGLPGEGGVWLGPGSDGATILSTSPGEASYLTQGQALSPWCIAAFNPKTAQQFVAGFLTGTASTPQLQLASVENGNASAFDLFRAECVYDPPVEVPPGGRLDSEVLYVALSEANHFDGLERYGHAVAVWNAVPRQSDPPLQGWAVDVGNMSAADIRASVNALPPALLAAGWNHVELTGAWESAESTLTPDESRFPGGFAPLTAALRASGYTTGLRVPAASLGADLPAIRANAQTIAHDWGVDALSITPLDGAAAASSSPIDTSEYLAAVNDGLGPGKVLIAAGDAPVMGLYAEYIMPPDASEALHRYYHAPYLARYLLPPLSLGDDLAFVTKLTQRALLGQGILLDLPKAGLRPWQEQILRAVSPAADIPARPLDLFDTENPAILVKDLGGWTNIGMYNWSDSQESTVTLDLRRAGMPPDSYFMVYDYLENRYLGTVQGALTAALPSHGMRGVILTKFQDNPLVLAPDTYISKRTRRLAETRWIAAQNMLEGSFVSGPEMDLTLKIYVPESYQLSSTRVSEGTVHSEMQDRVLTLRFSVPPNTAVQWNATF